VVGAVQRCERVCCEPAEVSPPWVWVLGLGVGLGA